MSLAETVINTFLDRALAQTPIRRSHPAKPRSVAKGLLAGLAAGIVASAAKAGVEKIYPPHAKSEPGHELAPIAASSSKTSHWVFGAATGAAYGALAEFYPDATSRGGINFGLTLMALTHEAGLPALSLAAEPASQTRREKSSEIASAIVFGLVAETTRRVVRKML